MAFHPLRSLAYRSSAVYGALLDRWPDGAREPKPDAPVTVLTFAGAAHGRMLRAFLDSLYRAWGALPRVVVAHDGSLDAEATRKRLSWWPDALEIVPWTFALPAIEAQGLEDLARFAARDVMARKMAAIVACATEGPTIYSDVDVLWFSEPFGWFGAETATPLLRMSLDFQPMYDERIVPALLPELGRPPAYCAGFLAARGAFLPGAGLAEAMRFAAEQGIGVTEQTILAAAMRRLGAPPLPAEQVVLTDEDRYSLGPSFLGRRWVARHYVGQVRHLMWRDALALRLGLKPATRTA